MERCGVPLSMGDPCTLSECGNRDVQIDTSTNPKKPQINRATCLYIHTHLSKYTFRRLSPPKSVLNMHMFKTSRLHGNTSANSPLYEATSAQNYKVANTHNCSVHISAHLHTCAAADSQKFLCTKATYLHRNRISQKYIDQSSKLCVAL